MYNLRDLACQHVCAKVFPLELISILLVALLTAQTHAVEIVVVSEKEGTIAPVANALVELNQSHLFTNHEGLAKFDLDSGTTGNLKITHPHYQLHQTNITGTTNPSESIQVVLKPIQLIEWMGVVNDDYTQTPVIGCRVKIEELESSGSITGTHFTTTDKEGTFRIRWVAVGKYNLSLSADGFDEIHRSISISHDAPETNYTYSLKATVERTESIGITVKNSVTDQPIANAKITLSEGIDKAIHQQATTAGNGQVQMKGLKTGQRNQALNNQIQLSTPYQIVKIEAPDFHTRSFPVKMGQNYTLNLDSIREISESETNDVFANANEVTANVDINHQIETRGDKDFFKFKLLGDAYLEIEGTGTLERHYSLFNEEGTTIASKGVYGNNSYHYQKDLAKGTYYLSVEEWGNNNESEEDQFIKLRTSSMPDAREPNNSIETSRLIRVGETIHGTIFPLGDKDFLRFRINTPGHLLFRMNPRSIEIHAEIRKSDTEEQPKLISKGVYGDQPLHLSTDIKEPGEYTLCLEEWGNNNYALESYEFTCELIPYDGFDDPIIAPENFAEARKWELNTRISNTILPTSDFDFYKIDVPSAGVIHLEATSPTEIHSTLFNTAGEKLTEKGVYANNHLILNQHLSGPQSVYFKIEEWGNNNESPHAYTMSNVWNPIDSNELETRNDGYDTATPLLCDIDVQANIYPIGDKDVYQFQVPFPGYLTIKGTSPTELHAQLETEDHSVIRAKGFYANNGYSIVCPVQTGLHYLRLEEWGNNSFSQMPYTLSLDLVRAEPDETIPLTEDPPRKLQRNEAQAFKIDQLGDADHFIYESGANDESAIILTTPIEIHIVVSNDQTGETILTKGFYPGNREISLVSKHPTRYKISLTEWGNNNCSNEPAYILVSDPGKSISAERIEIDLSPTDPKTVFFLRKSQEGIPPVELISVDIDLDGIPDLTIPKEGEVKYQYDKAEAHQAIVTMEAENGVKTIQKLWVDIPEKLSPQGIRISIPSLTQGETIHQPIDLTANVVNFTKSPIQKVEFTIDDSIHHTDYTAPYEFPIHWEQLEGNKHSIEVSTRNQRGDKTTLKRNFSLPPFFGLQPENGTNISGENGRISWTGNTFGSAIVKFREKGSESEWTTVTGESGRYRSVLLKGLEPGKSYEYEVSDGKSTSSLKTFNLVKGLAFGKTSYGANIKRDYDQRLGISVRNNGDEELTVNLVCGKPDDPLMLVGFVGEGSEDEPFPLQPGEEREFLLGISAQDVVTSEHSFPVRITSENGLADEAMVHLNVRLPVIKLEWQKLGDAPFGLGKHYRIRNKGDAITDLSVQSDNPEVTISPAIYHGLLPAGKSIDITAYPRLFDGFKKVDATLIAKGLDKTFEEPFRAALGPDEKLYQIYLLPEGNTMPLAQYDTCVKNAKAADKLEPDKIDWSRKELPEDLDGDEFPDRWHLFASNDILWVGDDTEGDGTIDFVHADIGSDGIFEYSAFKNNGQWERTNIVEAWLEMGFTLPWNRSSYHPHDVDIVMNNVVIGRLRDSIPDGNYSFLIPPKAFNFDKQGNPANNKIGISSSHLRGGHYVVNSDFRFNIRLTSTPVWSAAKSRKEAYEKAMKMDGLSLDEPDFSVSSSQMELIGPPELQPGMTVFVEVPLRNLGALSPPDVEVALMDYKQGKTAIEIGRTTIPHIPETGEILLRMPWITSSGEHTLSVIVDPEEKAGDMSRYNNEARIFASVTGDDAPPMLEVIEPLEGTVIEGTISPLKISVKDDEGMSRVEANIDGGLWTELSGTKQDVWEGKCLMQPGEHRLQVRALDISGNITETAFNVTVQAKIPKVEIVFPKPGKKIQSRKTNVMVSVSSDVALVGARMQGYPWNYVMQRASVAKLDVPLYYGKQLLELLVVSPSGVITTSTIPIECTRQPRPDQEKPNRTVDLSGGINVEGFGTIDPFKNQNLIAPLEYPK